MLSASVDINTNKKIQKFYVQITVLITVKEVFLYKKKKKKQMCFGNSVLLLVVYIAQPQHGFPRSCMILHVFVPFLEFPSFFLI